ncbi:MAG TPA: competence/damage-inducible protein A [Candidatus Dormibacteraeota bacterium]|jgi:nicotinamide-nucleotide amidase|nr:competence/damage-inducible protein A [Candidatus Dormibacteraeota bacterium]
MRAEIIAIGSELLTPYRLDTNSLFLTDGLNQVGIRVVHKAVVGDSLDDMRASFRQALDRADLVVACGGLGPTDDDRTREAVADLLSRKLELNEGVLRHIQELFRRFGRVMPEINRRQAMVPEGATVIPNPRGSAPGLWIETSGHIVILLPGVPSELRAMFEQEIRPRLTRLGHDERLFTRDLRITGLPESEVEQRVSPLYALYPDTETTILASPPGIQLHPRVWSRDPAQANQILDEMVKRMALALGEHLYSTEGEAMEEVVARALTENRATIAVAESCTGGLLAERLTNIPGSSVYFLGGVVCYSNELKSALVDVPAELIESKGAVSPEVALALADGIRKRTGATIGVGVTGIAGPGGGTPEKPVGLVHVGIADERGPRERRFQFPGDRERIRMHASQTALDSVRRYFLFPRGRT